MSDDTRCTDIKTPAEKLDCLREEHRKLDIKIKELTAVSYLTSEEQIEVARLKKQKLSLKDEIFKLASSLGVEP